MKDENFEADPLGGLIENLNRVKAMIDKSKELEEKVRALSIPEKRELVVIDGKKTYDFIIEKKAYEVCTGDECEMGNVFFDFSDEELEGAVTILCRTVHAGSSYHVALLSHLINEQLIRETLSDDKIIV